MFNRTVRAGFLRLLPQPFPRPRPARWAERREAAFGSRSGPPTHGTNTTSADFERKIRRIGGSFPRTGATSMFLCSHYPHNLTPRTFPG